MSQTKRNHFIQQYLLEGFANPPGNRLWMYERGKSKAIPTNTPNLAVETGLYPQDVEDYITQQIEAPALAVIDKVRSREVLSENDKTALAIYIEIQRKRVPATRDRLQENAPRIADQVLVTLNHDIDAAIAQDPARAAYWEEKRREGIQIIEERKRHLPDEIFWGIISPRIFPHIAAMQWQFLVYQGDIPFLVNDNPVFYHKHHGIQNAELLMPIARDVVLWAIPGPDTIEGYFRTAEQIVREINRRTVNNAHRFVYSAVQAPWISMLVRGPNQREPRSPDWIWEHQRRMPPL